MVIDIVLCTPLLHCLHLSIRANANDDMEILKASFNYLKIHPELLGTDSGDKQKHLSEEAYC